VDTFPAIDRHMHRKHELPKRKADPQSEAGRLAVQGVRLRIIEEKAALRAEEGEEITRLAKLNAQSEFDSR
jgi:hypothetical protein